jgi:selenocysteine lyase/cysteine desulfurase
VTPDVFRSGFPALEHTVWLDTPAAAPGAGPVVDAVAEALELWRSGERHWSAWWEETRRECRSLIAAYLGVPDSCVALMGSFAEAAATVAACLPPGRSPLSRYSRILRGNISAGGMKPIVVVPVHPLGCCHSHIPGALPWPFTVDKLSLVQ